MTTKFIPTHTLTIDGRTQAVAVVDDDWTPCAPTAGAQLVTREEWEAEGSVSYTLDDEERLCCNGDAYSIGGNSWELSEMGPSDLVLYEIREAVRAKFGDLTDLDNDAIHHGINGAIWARPLFQLNAKGVESAERWGYAYSQGTVRRADYNDAAARES